MADTLTRFKYLAQAYVSTKLDDLNDLIELDVSEHKTLDGLVVGLTARVFGQRLKKVVVSYPVMPKWLLRLFPHRTAYVEVDVIALYPQIKTGGVPNVTVIAAIDDDGDEWEVSGDSKLIGGGSVEFIPPKEG